MVGMFLVRRPKLSLCFKVVFFFLLLFLVILCPVSVTWMKAGYGVWSDDLSFGSGVGFVLFFFFL